MVERQKALPQLVNCLVATVVWNVVVWIMELRRQNVGDRRW